MTSELAVPMNLLPVCSFLERISLLLHQMRIYPPEHRSVDRQVDSTLEAYRACLEQEEILTFVFKDGGLYYGEHLLDPRLEVKYLSQLLHAMRVLRIGELSLKQGFGREELVRLMTLLKAATGGSRSGDVGSLWEDMPSVEIRQVSQRSAESDDFRPSNDVEISYGQVQPEVYREAKDSMVEIVEGIRKLKRLKMSEAETTALDVIDGMRRNSKAMLLMSSLKDHDPYTFTHSVNVAVLTIALAMALDYREAELSEIGVAALLHDIGKIHIPTEVLLKDAELTPYEWQLVKRHPADGAEIIRSIDEPKYELAIRVAYEHHMRWDRKGYPMPRPKYAIHPVSHIVRVVDSYDALTTVRPYRRQLTPFQALSVLRETSGEYNPDYLQGFIRIMGRYPLGTVVRLDTQETAMVVEVNPANPERPRVRIVEDALGGDRRVGVVVDLAEMDPGTGKPLRSITTTLERPVGEVDLGIYL
jgi:putative nucleotidyltransferase with HDIG domain